MPERYVLIDNYSGYIVRDSADFNGKVFTGSPVEFAKAVDENSGEHGRAYVETARADNSSVTGYHVYRVPDAIPVVDDGQDEKTIDAVKAESEYCGFIEISEPEQDY
jgi:hypothetical protein